MGLFRLNTLFLTKDHDFMHLSIKVRNFKLSRSFYTFFRMNSLSPSFTAFYLTCSFNFQKFEESQFNQESGLFMRNPSCIRILVTLELSVIFARNAKTGTHEFHLKKS
eukprot:TRINITY_DN11734_c0_g5_i1.p1 TRINITY_DN11734_c0_g5~~TRINITY_DN11734_c0_g5_i1.p1  ORF type:complete len:108 (-),score=1.88 TRINITY_DN11734_c0_g5_i1:1348-1671(-)